MFKRFLLLGALLMMVMMTLIVSLPLLAAEGKGAEGVTAVVSNTSHIATFTWTMSGTQLITVTAANSAGNVTSTHTIHITTPQLPPPPEDTFSLFLPFAVKPSNGL